MFDELKIAPALSSNLPGFISGNACSSGAADAGEVRTVAGNTANGMHLKKHLGSGDVEGGSWVELANPVSLSD